MVSSKVEKVQPEILIKEGEIYLRGKENSIGEIDYEIYKDTVIIYDFRMHEEKYLGRGYGGKAFRLLEEKLRKEGVKLIRLEDVLELDAGGFWERMGFRWDEKEQRLVKRLNVKERDDRHIKKFATITKLPKGVSYV